eukprot:2818099-Amphidinium_carterae.1
MPVPARPRAPPASQSSGRQRIPITVRPPPVGKVQGPKSRLKVAPQPKLFVRVPRPPPPRKGPIHWYRHTLVSTAGFSRWNMCT